jgi:hypothetical protein
MKLPHSSKEYEGTLLNQLFEYAKRQDAVLDDVTGGRLHTILLTILLSSAALSEEGQEVYEKGCFYLSVLSHLKNMLKDYPASTPDKTIPAAVDKANLIKWQIDNGYMCVYNTHTKWNGETWVKE